MCTIDWELVVRVIESPVLGAAVGVPLAAALAIRGFRRQKAIERRADWYERVHRDLIAMKSAYAIVVSPSGSLAVIPDHAMAQTVQNAQLSFIASSAEAAMYAERRALSAVMALRHGLEVLAAEEDRAPLTRAHFDGIAMLIQQASDEVADEFRADMKMSARRL